MKTCLRDFLLKQVPKGTTLDIKWNELKRVYTVRQIVFCWVEQDEAMK